MVSESRMIDLLLKRQELLDGGVQVSPNELTDNPEEIEELLVRIHKIEAANKARTKPPRIRSSTPSAPNIPEYEILECLGNGGMGVVWKARHIKLGRTVALKLIRSGRFASASELRRFQVEVETIAQLDHENIVQVYESGDYEGQCYYSMQFIEGKSLQSCLKDQNSRSSKEGQKLAASLMVTIARAVDHAHKRGILHRDLKPANILLTPDGKAYVADFGLAKSLLRESGGSHKTSADGFVGTPSYMSPEQAEGKPDEVTYVSDVYGLGAVLYEMLTGKPPFAGHTPLDTIRQVIESSLKEPRKLVPSVDRRLETICLKCLDKQQARRYATASDLACDLERWGRGESIEAQPNGSLTKLWLWCRRKPMLASLLAALIFTILLGLIGVVWQWQEAVWEKGQKDIALLDAVKKKEQAEYARDGANAIKNFIAQRILRAPRFSGRGGITREVTLRAALDAAAPRIQDDFAGQPELEAAVRFTLGSTYLELGANSEAVTQFDKALKLRTELYGSDHEDSVSTKSSLASAFLQSGKIARAEGLYREALETRVRMLGSDDLKTQQSKNNLAAALIPLDKLTEAELILREALKIQYRDLPLNHRDTLDTESNLATLLQKQRKHNESEILFRKVWTVSTKSLGPKHPNTMEMQLNLAASLGELRKFEDGDRLLRAMLPDAQAIFGPTHEITLKTQHNLAVFLLIQKKLDDAEVLMRQTWNTLLAAPEFGPDHPETLNTESSLAAVLNAVGKLKEAEPLNRHSYDVFLRLYGPKHSKTLTAQNNLAMILFNQKNYAEAERLFLNRYETLLAIPSTPAANIVFAVDRIVALYEAWGQTEQANAWRGKRAPVKKQ